MFLISALLLFTALHHNGVQAQFLNCDWIKSLNCATYTAGVVCGSNGHDYANMCYLSKAQCSDSTIRTVGEGTCASNGYKSSGTTNPTCSWGSWLPWDCSCCGGYIDNIVYRVRARCCENSVCTQLRVDADKVTSIGTNYQQHGTCDKNCPHQFGHNHGHMCLPKMPTLEEIAWTNKSQSCLSVCLDIISTTTAITSTNRPFTTRAKTTTATVSQATSDPLHVICDLVSHSHCHNDVEPVCGSNNITYINTCEFQKEVCKQHDLAVNHMGFC